MLANRSMINLNNGEAAFDSPSQFTSLNLGVFTVDETGSFHEMSLHQFLGRINR